MDGRQYSKSMIEPMLRYILETTPRIDEIVPTQAKVNLHLKQSEVTPVEPVKTPTPPAKIPMHLKKILILEMLHFILNGLIDIKMH